MIFQENPTKKREKKRKLKRPKKRSPLIYTHYTHTHTEIRGNAPVAVFPDFTAGWMMMFFSDVDVDAARFLNVFECPCFFVLMPFVLVSLSLEFFVVFNLRYLKGRLNLLFSPQPIHTHNSCFFEPLVDPLTCPFSFVLSNLSPFFFFSELSLLF